MTPTTSSFTFNWLVIGEHVVFAVSVVLDRHLLYIACCSDWNAKAKSFCSGTKWAHWITPESAVLYLRKRRVREENILAKSVSGIIYVWRCLQWRNRRWWLHCSKPPPPIKTWTMSIRTVMYHTIKLVWSLWNFQSRQGYNFAKLSGAMLNWGTEYAWVFYILLLTASRHCCPCHRWALCVGSSATV